MNLSKLSIGAAIGYGLLISATAWGDISGRYMHIDIPRAPATLSLAEVRVFKPGENMTVQGAVNLALNKPARQIATANDGVASRAVDGNDNGEWSANSITHTPENIPNPWWEVDLGSMQPIGQVSIWNRTGFESRLNDVRLRILDANRVCVWEGSPLPTPGAGESYWQITEPAEGESIGKKIEAVEDPNVKSVQPKDDRPQTIEGYAAALYNEEALLRAVDAYAKKYPNEFTDADALKQEIKEAAGTAHKADAVRYALMRKILARHPAYKQLQDILYIRRNNANNIGMPANWQGNSSISPAGYDNALMRTSLKPGDTPREVYASDAFIGDLALNFEADTLAFATRKLHLPPGTKPGWCVAEMKLDNPATLKELTPTNKLDVDYYDPMYLPNGNMMLVGSSGFQGVPCVAGSDYVGNLLLRQPDGKLRRLSYDQDNNWCPVMLPNGRCLYLRWEYADSAHYFSRILMTMNPDGSDQQEYYGSNSYWPNSLFYAKPLPGSSTKFIAIVSGHHGVARKGEMVLFDVEKGRQETAGAVQKLPGWGKPVQNRTRDELVNHIPQFFLHPIPLSDELFLVAMQDKKVSGRFFIAAVDIYDNQIPLLIDSEYNLIQPLPVVQMPKPVDILDTVDLSKTNFTVNLVSVYNGPGLAGVPRGTAKKFRIYNFEYSPRNIGGHYTIGMESGWDPRVILGTVDIETDGSCMFEAPANVPLAMQPLDAEGNHLQEMRSWFVGMPGEILSCVGCHEKQNSASPNVRTIASRKKPQQIKPFYGERRGFSFDREVQNLLDRKCAGCHDGTPEKKNRMGQKLPDFTKKPDKRGFSMAYNELHPFIRRNGPEGDYHLLTPLEFNPNTSELIQLLKKGHKGVKLDAEEWDRLLTWIGLNVPYFGTWTEMGAKKNIIERRREEERELSNLTFDPERILNPYKPVEFVAPAPQPKPAPAPTVANWPLEKPGEYQKNKDKVVLALGNDEKLTLVHIPAGEFVMGTNDETPAEQPMCAVKIKRSFWMGETEVSVAQFRAFEREHDNGVYDMHYKDQVKRGYYMNDDSEFAVKGNEQYPAIRITWEKAQAFCDWLSKKSGMKVRLPTEAQWEWACRAGTDTPMNFGGFDADFSKHANLAGSERIEMAVVGIDPKPWRNPPASVDFELRDPRFTDGVLHLAKVGSYAPNAWGLKDMHGNVAEWTRTAYRPYPYADDGRDSGKPDGLKVVRGGSWNDRQIKATSTWRWAYPVWQKPFDVGFRVVVEEN